MSHPTPLINTTYTVPETVLKVVSEQAYIPHPPAKPEVRTQK